MASKSIRQRANTADFSIEYYAESAHLSQRQRNAVETRLQKLAAGHRDIAGASVAVERIGGDARYAKYKARLVIYCKPSNVAAVHKSDSISDAVSEALEAAERQIRSQRERVRERSRAARA